MIQNYLEEESCGGTRFHKQNRSVDVFSPLKGENLINYRFKVFEHVKARVQGRVGYFYCNSCVSSSVGIVLESSRLNLFPIIKNLSEVLKVGVKGQGQG